jgi:hypothetical protein
MSSTEMFARNVTAYGGLGHHLIEVARLEMGTQANDEAIEKRASNLMLEALLKVGLNPKSQSQVARKLKLLRALKGENQSDTEIRKNLNYILDQMISQSKAALAECLAIKPCLEHLHSLIEAGQLPPKVEFQRGVWQRRVKSTAGSVQFLAWQKGADGLFCLPATPETWKIFSVVKSDCAPTQKTGLLIFGVVEVKAYHGVDRNKLQNQKHLHIARLRGGLQIRDHLGRCVESEYAPENLWYATWDGEKGTALPVTNYPFELIMTPKGNSAEAHGNKTKKILWKQWEHPLMESVIQFTVGPNYRLKQDVDWFVETHNFDATLPYGEQDLQDMGAAMAIYTLGVMADQPEVDLNGEIWTQNIVRALRKQPNEVLTIRQEKRRKKLRSLLGDDDSV